MTVPASKVRSCCTQSEVALVRASRKGQLERLSHAELKRHAARARTLFDKWQGLGRGQSRTRGRKHGFGEHEANTELKQQIFRDALASFEAQLKKQEAPAAKGPKPKMKRHRTAEHRSTRAAIRKGMTAVEDLLNTKRPRKKTPSANGMPVVETQVAPAAAAPVASEAAQTPSPAKPATRARSAAKAGAVAKAAPPAKRAANAPKVESSKRVKVTTAAKTARLVASGKKTRMQAQVIAHGKRTQARRDSKG